MKALLGMLLLFLCGCTRLSQDYVYLREPLPAEDHLYDSEYYIVFLVDARHLDYSNGRSFLKTVAKHPSDASKGGDVGHAWIELHGNDSVIEGGHSGERGALQARYWEGVFNGCEYGCPNPTEEDYAHPKHDPNPIRYLWEPQGDGFFEAGSGGHAASFAAKVDLSLEQFQTVFAFLKQYDYTNYSLTGQQCSSFVAEVAACIGFSLDHQVTLKIEQEMDIAGYHLHLWTDPQFSTITFSSPDRIEKSLMDAVRHGRAQNATHWYRSTHPQSKPNTNFLETVWMFPERFARFLAL